MDASSTPGAIWVVLTVILAAIPIWVCHMVNTLWLRPKRLERHLRAQGLHGDPYKLSLDNSKQTYMLKLQQEAQSKSIGLSKDDAAPRIFSLAHQTVHKYGKNSFAWEGTAPKVIITDPEQIKEVFNKIQDFPKPKLNPIAKYISIGLVQYEGDKWAKHRKIINPAFHLEKLKGMLPAFSHSCHEMISKWKGLLSSDGTCEVDVWPFLQNLTCDVISRTAFGSSYAEGAKIFELLKRQGYALMTARYARIPLWWLLPSTTKRRMKEIERGIRDSLEGIIRKREKALKSGKSTDDDLLGILLQSNHIENKGDENSKSAGMTTQEVMEECKLFYLAGQETTAALLAWTMVLLGKHPEWQARARQEVLQVFGNQNPNFEGLGRLKIVTMILYEVLRLYPPGIYLTRALRKDLKLGNLLLPAGVQVSVPILLIHHDEGIWGNDAKEFNPERFAEGIAKATKGQVCYFPFGWGPRICVGQNFALLEAKIVLSLLLQNFSFELSPTYAHVPTTVLTLQPKHGAPIILHKL
uniref:11-oxo-beta-amyrin 30-oxidase n=1 Tax=Glycyrrhiza uralensis TaxID=74613 RepID=C7254_GLYUR|nr:RecName: Full=11-oxo-beta-amyrin 30-oxidase; AltName: Full=Cytochrome P450 72A154 [Glycyrrhiza uralensis]BAL45207.1 cytochrome P450 monooxygenase [Glycyrrhiza uralensis]